MPLWRSPPSGVSPETADVAESPTNAANPARVPGTRTTRQRLAVANALSDSNEFRSAQEWHDLLARQGESVGLTTVYRTLQALVDSGDVDMIVGADGENKFRRCSAGHHHHLVCRGCGKTVEVSARAMERWARSVAEEHGFSAERHTLEISGLCSKCSAGGAR